MRLSKKMQKVIASKNGPFGYSGNFYVTPYRNENNVFIPRPITYKCPLYDKEKFLLPNEISVDQVYRSVMISDTPDNRKIPKIASFAKNVCIKIYPYTVIDK